MAMFKAFKPSGMEKIARAMGYQGNMQGFKIILRKTPCVNSRCRRIKIKLCRWRGGVVKMQEGGTTPTNVVVGRPVDPNPQQPYTQLPQQAVPTLVPADAFTKDEKPTIGDVMTRQAMSPGLPTGGAVAPVGTVATPSEMIDPTTGQVTGAMAVPTAMAETVQADPQQDAEAAQVQASTAAPAVSEALNATQAAQGVVDPRAEVIAAQQTASSVGSLDAAQGNAILIDNSVQREITGWRTYLWFCS